MLGLPNRLQDEYLTLGRSRQRALVAFVPWLLAIIAEAFGGRADLGVVAHVAALIACAPR
jgi:hypothetical protein